MFSVLGERSMKILPLGKPEDSKKGTRVAVLLGVNYSKAHSDGR